MKQNLERKLDSINELLKCCVDKKGHHYVDYAELTDSQVMEFIKRFKLDFDGYKRMMSTDEINHAYLKHRKDRCPLLLEDFLLVPYICENFDSVEVTRLSKQTQNLCLRYKKVIGDTYFVVEEIRTGRKKLAFKTMYKKGKRPR